GILVTGGSGGVIQGNLIGTDVTGTAALGNSTGIEIAGSGISGYLVGGTAPGSRNVVSGNPASGILILNGPSATLVQGNYIGTNASGTTAVGNGIGVLVQNASNNTVGGTADGAGNLISGNLSALVLTNGANGNRVQGNLIGTDATGTQPLGNLVGVL